ncbi:hypothetical protein F5H01DRAFT_348559 [Linnemannia elongata]|nr:hypothetical protein F5H01DRAFT_348559 [Linnemannia elongata]
MASSCSLPPDNLIICNLVLSVSASVSAVAIPTVTVLYGSIPVPCPTSQALLNNAICSPTPLPLSGAFQYIFFFTGVLI